MDNQILCINAAIQAAQKAKPHISKYHVGCAILSTNGKMYLGANIEFDNFSNTLHAEEVAISAMLMDGGLPEIVAVYTFDDPPWFPCGMCRQSLFEVCPPETPIIATNGDTFLVKTIAELLPDGFCLGRSHDV